MVRRFTEPLWRYFLSGLIAFLPLAITVWMLDAVVRMMDGGLELLPRPFRPSTYNLVFDFPGVGAVFTFLMICLIGVFVTHLVGSKVHRTWASLLARIPFVRAVYGAISQLVHALLSPEKGKYRGVVLVEYPRKGLYAIGFVTGLAEGELQEKTGDRVLNVLIPTTPNPTSGWYVLVPEREAMSLDMSVEEAFKVIISGGMVVPDRQAPGELQDESASVTRRA